MISSTIVMASIVIIVILSIVSISPASAKVHGNVEEACHHESCHNNASVGDDQADILELDLATRLLEHANILQLLTLDTLENGQKQSKTPHSSLQNTP